MGQAAARCPVIQKYTQAQEVTLIEVHERLEEHIREVNKLKSDLERAFPADRFGEPDYHGHGEYHQRRITDENKLNELKDTAVKRVVSGGVWALVIFLAIASWEYFKGQVHK